MKEKGKKKTERKEKIYKDEKIRKTRDWRTRRGRKTEKEERKLEGKVFPMRTPKGDHEHINIKGKFDKMKTKSDEKMSEKKMKV